ncbi:MAG: TatD family hydrolase [Candidatus Pacebacteria bacterium]|nr:TatD family hydrolase [Candidatus Paceibacterota bacterium]
MKYIDIHAHLNFPEYDGDRAEVIKRTLEAEVGVINIGTDKKTSAEVVKLAEENQDMWAVIGSHPHAVEEGFDYDFYKNLAIHPKVVAIGECGLDYFRIEDEETKVKQQELFKQQIALAKEVGKPLMLHIRDSYEDVLAMLEGEQAGRAHAHFFAGSWEVAQKLLSRGDSLSFTGLITFTDAYDEVIKNVPLDKLMAETDAPYVAPVPYRGKRNEPVYVKEVVAKIALLKNLPEPEVAAQLLQNTKQFFGL